MADTSYQTWTGCSGETGSSSEYWAHQASIVLTEDYPLFYRMMRKYPEEAPWPKLWRTRIRAWVSKNPKVSRYVLKELSLKGPRLSRQFEKNEDGRGKDGWSSGSDVTRMIHHLFLSGKVMVVGRQGNQKVWGLTDGFLPDWAEKEELPEEEVEYRAVQRSIRALGIASKRQIKYHFLRGRYPNIDAVLQRLESESAVSRVLLRGRDVKKEPYYVHADDLRTLDRIESDRWEPRTTVLSPFDNLICDRARTEEFFGFRFRVEIYTPKEQRKHGYYVLPILHGDRLIGRVDPMMDRKRQRLVVNAVHAEKGAPEDRQTAAAVASALEDLGGFLGAKEVSYSAKVPEFWRSSLR
ncbi:MAG: YcaQ family DNA glycosylase [Thaumarchaeota archaeon]|nr:YcaQ family DNA glycosylase [Nitrososphaerota archaeon]